MAISEQPVPNIVFNGERLKASHENKEKDKECPCSHPYSKQCLKSVRTRQEKELKSVDIVKVDVKVPCIAYDVGQNQS